MNLSPGLFAIPSQDLPIPLPTVPDNTPLPPGVLRPPNVRPPPPLTSGQILQMIQRARATGASPFAIAQLERQYNLAIANERAAATLPIGTNAPGSPNGAAPTAAQNLTTFAIMTAPAWLVLGLLHFTKKRAR
jgi:hypothetical protein